MRIANWLEFAESNRRVVGALTALLICAGLIALLAILLPVPEAGSNQIYLSALLLDRASAWFPFTVQNIMWLIFSVGIAEITLRFNRASSEIRQLSLELLPEDASTILRSQDLIPVYRRISRAKNARHFRLQRILLRVIQQFQISRSADQANNLLNSSLELIQHEIDLRYNMMRYIVWLIPTLGFIGTVIGIALALSAANDMPSLDDAQAVQVWFGTMTTKLGLAFNTTFLALILAAILVFLQHIAQGKEETALNSAGQYCLDNLINRLYEE
ncbi:MAG: MotA/TolQ/ExbB proton channel family protein [Bacteroidota bacterium]|nr:MotA/TolQ/ExbB proton channel family protein [Bacteroidota bacterium]